MKKILFSLCLLTLLPSLWNGSFSVCLANDDNPLVIDRTHASVASSYYYNQDEQQLYVYFRGLAQMANITVSHNGETVFTDVVSAGTTTAVYDLADEEEGVYQVSIFIGTKLLGTYSFERF